MKTKKILSMLLVLCMLFTMLPTTVLATEESTVYSNNEASSEESEVEKSSAVKVGSPRGTETSISNLWSIWNMNQPQFKQILFNPGDSIHNDTGTNALVQIGQDLANVKIGASYAIPERCKAYKMSLPSGGGEYVIFLNRVAYTVKFNLQNHGQTSIPDVEFFNNGEQLTEPATPMEPNYRFDGWFTDPTCTDKYDFTRLVSKSFTLYAKWTPTYVSVTGVSLDKNTMDLTVGATGSLTATVTPDNASDKNVSWKSSDTTVADVANGTVTAKKAGKTTITATTNATDGAQTATCTVTVREDGTTAKLGQYVTIPGGGLTYRGSAFTATKNQTGATAAGWGAITLSYKQNNIPITAPTAAGKYDVYVSTAQGTKYNALPEVRLDSFTIDKKNVFVESGITAADKTYDGNSTAVLDCSSAVMNGKVVGDSLGITAIGTFINKTAAKDKTVNLTGFTLTGPAAANYNHVDVSAQKTTTASINKKEATIAVVIKDKQFDGTNTAEINTSALTGKVVGDMVTITNGTPTFASTNEGIAVAINFITPFSIFGTDAGNYSLTQPTGITGNIVNNFNPVKDMEYTTTTNDWSNQPFVITAKSGYKIATAVTGSWEDTLQEATDTADGKLSFYVKDTGTGAISNKVTENYKIDRTAPIINDITDDATYYVDTKFSATDATSGIQSVVVDGNTVTSNPMITGNIASSNLAVIATDHAGNKTTIKINTKTIISISTAIAGLTTSNVKSSDKGKIDTAKTTLDDIVLTDATPEQKDEITAAKQHCTELLAQISKAQADLAAAKNAADSTTLATVTADNSAALTAALAAAQNVSEVNLTSDEKTELDANIAAIESYIAKIKQVADDLSAVGTETAKTTLDSVNTDDKDDIEGILEKITALEKLAGNLTSNQSNELAGYKKSCSKKIEQIDSVSSAIAKIKKDTDGKDESNIKSSDKEGLNDAVIEIDKLLGTMNLTDDERIELNEKKALIPTLLDKIEATRILAETCTNLIAAYDINEIKSTDKDGLDAVIVDLDNLLDSKNLTEDERKSLEAVKKTATALTDKIADTVEAVQSLTDLIAGYDIDMVKSSDKDRIDAAVADIDQLLGTNNLTEDEIKSLTAAKEAAPKLLQKIVDTLGAIKTLTDLIAGYDLDSVKLADKEKIDVALSGIGKLLGTKNLTEEETKTLNAAKKTAEALLAKIVSVKVIVDKTTDISVKYENGASFDSTFTLSVTAKSEKEMNQFKDAIAKAAPGFVLGELYDIKLLKDGVSVQPDGKIKVSIPLTEKMKTMTDLKVIYMDDNGNVTIIPSEVIDGKIVFVTDHFSYYGVIGKTKTSGTNSPHTGDHTNANTWILLAAASLGLIAVIVIVKKRKSNRTVK